MNNCTHTSVTQKPSVVKSDALRSLDSAIAAALRSGAGSSEISRVVDTATSKFQDHRRRSSYSLYRFILCFFAVMLSIAKFLTFPVQQFYQPTEVKSVFTEVKLKEENSSGSNFSIANDEKNFTIQTVRHILDLTMNYTKNPCPLDAFFNEECENRDGGTVCIFPGAILKRMNSRYLTNEMKSHKVLNDTRLFPELYYGDHRCRTLLQENVRPRGKNENEWSANYTYYEHFYNTVFEIFNANNIIPQDLNTCCNTIANGEHIRVIDFGMYQFDEEPEVVREDNKELLDNILKAVFSATDEYKEEHKKTNKRKHRDRRKRRSTTWKPPLGN
jgi:tRNA A-37 threonylcarbamoyl transferase component Bud32